MVAFFLNTLPNKIERETKTMKTVLCILNVILLVIATASTTTLAIAIFLFNVKIEADKKRKESLSSLCRNKPSSLRYAPFQTAEGG